MLRSCSVGGWRERAWSLSRQWPLFSIIFFADDNRANSQQEQKFHDARGQSDRRVRLTPTADKKRTMKPGGVAVIPGGAEYEGYFRSGRFLRAGAMTERCLLAVPLWRGPASAIQIRSPSYSPILGTMRLAHCSQ